MTTAAPSASASPPQQTPSPASPPTSLPDRFAALCKANPPPKLLPADLPHIPDTERALLRQNASGEIFVASDALWDSTEDKRHLVAAAIRKALHHVAASHSVPPAPEGNAKAQADARASVDANPDANADAAAHADATAATAAVTVTPTSTATTDSPNQLEHSARTPDHNSPTHSAHPYSRPDPLDPLPLTSTSTTSPLTSPTTPARSSEPTTQHTYHHATPATYDIDDDPPDGSAKSATADHDVSGDMSLNARLADLAMSSDSDTHHHHSAAGTSSPPHPSPPASETARPESSLLELLGQPRFTPLPRLSTFTWGSSHAKRELDTFNAESQRLARARATSGTPSPQAAARKKRPSAAAPKHTAKLPPPVDPVQLAAQEEAAAAAVLRDLRVANSRLRRPSFRQAETPVWAIVAQRGGRMKPEAAAEMARARVAAAAAAAVMREASNGGTGGRGDADDGAGDGEGSAAANGGANDASQRGRHIDELDDDNFVRHNDRHEFFREYVSPRSRTYSSDTGLFPMHGGQLPATALTMDGVGRGKVGDKKRVAFAEDTVFTSK